MAPAGTFEEVLDVAVDFAARPFLLSDSGDNPTAGGAGDSTVTLHALLAATGSPPASSTWCCRTSPTPSPPAAAWRTGGGRGGGARPRRPRRHHRAPPVPFRGTVTAVDHSVGVRAVVRRPVSVVVTERRAPLHREAEFQALGLDLRAADVVVVKIVYLEPDLFALAADWRLALTPGGVDQDLLRLGHRNLGGPVFPFDPDPPTPT